MQIGGDRVIRGSLWLAERERRTARGGEDSIQNVQAITFAQSFSALLEVVWVNFAKRSDFKALFTGKIVVLAGAQTGYV